MVGVLGLASQSTCQNLLFCIIAPCAAFPCSFGNGVVGGQRHGCRFFLNSVRVGQVYVFPVSYELFFGNGYLGYGSVAFGHNQRPTVFGPTDAAYMS